MKSAPNKVGNKLVLDGNIGYLISLNNICILYQRVPFFSDKEPGPIKIVCYRIQISSSLKISNKNILKNILEI